MFATHPPCAVPQMDDAETLERVVSFHWYAKITAILFNHCNYLYTGVNLNLRLKFCRKEKSDVENMKGDSWVNSLFCNISVTEAGHH